MKKITAVIMLCLALTLVACNKNPEAQTHSTTTPDTTKTSELDTSMPTAASPTETTESPELAEQELPPIRRSFETEVTFAPLRENDITITASSLVGIPFADDSATPERGFDNSGFVYYVLTQNGFVNCPRLVSQQAQMGNEINSLSDLRSGDLVFFSTGRQKAEFGGIYIGDGIFIYSPMPGEVVKEQTLDTDFWKEAFYIGIRVL